MVIYDEFTGKVFRILRGTHPKPGKKATRNYNYLITHSWCNSTGAITIGTICFPKKYIGKRIQIFIKVLDDTIKTEGTETNGTEC